MIDLTRILCPVDFSPYSDRALIYAMQMAKWYNASLHVLHVMPPMPPSTVNALAATSRALTERNLRDVIDRYRLPGVDVAAEVVESAEPTARILESADRFDADLIVTGSHGRSGVQRVLLGSVVEGLLHRSRRAVLTVPSHIEPKRLNHANEIRRMICAVDFAAPSLAGLAFAFSLAEEADAQLTLLNVIELPPELQAHQPVGDVDRLRAEAEADNRNRLRALVPDGARDYCTVETEVLEGGAARQILRLASRQDADLIVLGVHGRNAFDLAFFGSTSKDVIRQAQCPVLVVPAPGRKTMRAAS